MASSSMALKGGFIIIVIIAFLITLVSIFTPGWKVSNNAGSDQKIGLVTNDCGNQQGQIMQQGCNQSSDNRQGFEKWTLALLILAAIIQIIAIICAIATIKSETKIFILAPIMAIIAIILIVIAIIVYGSKINDTQNQFNQFYQPGQPQPQPQQNYQYSMNGNFSLGYSFWLAIVAGIFLVVAAILGIIAALRGGNGSGSGGYLRNQNHHDRTVIQSHQRVRTSMPA
uniref:Store-operated calcium entry-associated regulatory factor n=1 Tax=Panagrolaimus superbus TaxID=310955 RepID=A0A914YDU0_9BILA